MRAVVASRGAGGRSARALVLTALGLYTLSRALAAHTLLFAEWWLVDVPVAVGARFRGWSRMLLRWDAGYYEAIAADFYPSTLPVDQAGAVGQNVWAFFPAFPLTVGALARLTGLDFLLVATIVNLLAGAGASVALALMVRAWASEAVARRAVLLWAFFPTAFVLQVPYAEAMAAAAAAGCLWALVTARYGTAAACLLAAGLARGFALPLAVAAVVAVILRIGGPDREPIGRRGSRLAAAGGPSAIVLLAAAGIAPFVWVAIAALVTGQADAYAATQRAWGFDFDLRTWLSRWPDTLASVGADRMATASVGTLAAAAGLAAASFRLPMPWPLRAYGVAATLLLLVAALPGAVAFTSIPRFAFGVLTIPVTLALVLRHRLALGIVLAIFLLLQWLWVLNVWSGRLGVAP